MAYPDASKTGNDSGNGAVGNEQFFERLRSNLKEELKRPWPGAAVAGAVVLGAAAVFGAAEAAVGAVAAYITYEMIKGASRRRPPPKEPSNDEPRSTPKEVVPQG